VQRAEEGVWTNVNAIESVVADVNVRGWLKAVANQPARATFGIASTYIGTQSPSNLFVCVTGPKDPLAAARVPEANAVRDVNTIRATLELDKSERTQRWLEREAAKPPPPRPPLKERLNASYKSTYPLLTNGLPGSELKYLLPPYIARAACAPADYPDARPPPITKHQRQQWPDDDD
jgi:hypothetical protein